MDTQTHLEIHKILVVDDDVRLRTLLQRFLEEQGYSCLLYTSPSPRDRTRSRMPSSA